MLVLRGHSRVALYLASRLGDPEEQPGDAAGHKGREHRECRPGE